jgi:hypothetical protein
LNEGGKLEGMMNDEQRQAAIDAVTVGQIRKRYLNTLEDQIAQLANMIRAGYHKRPQAEKFLNEDIGRTLTSLQNIDAMASTEVLFP